MENRKQLQKMQLYQWKYLLKVIGVYSQFETFVQLKDVDCR